MHRRRHHGHGPHCEGHARFRQRRRLFWRVYLHGIGLLIAVVAAVAIVGWAVGRGGGTWRQAGQFYRMVEEGGPALLDDRAALQSLIERAGESANADVTLYSPAGELLASNVEPPLPPLSRSVVERLGSDWVQVGRSKWNVVIPIRHQGALTAYGVAEWRGPGAREIARGALILGGIMAALALASFPLVRTIVAPLEKLTRAAKALGEGDLSTRSGLKQGGEVGELARAFDDMAERLERQVKNERALLANVSHELRTPLSRIRVALELGAEGDARKAQQYLKEIGSDLAELETLVEDVLTAARLETQTSAGAGFPLHTSRVSAAELVEASARRFKERWPDRALNVEVPTQMPVVDADPMLLRRALDNLLDNARKYSEDGKPVSLHASVEGALLRVDVRDEGIGMSEEDLRQLFTPFFRSDESRARGTGGVGLGLALARRIVEAHKGTLTVRSAPGEGSTFSVRLPVAEVEGGARAQTS